MIVIRSGLMELCLTNLKKKHCVLCVECSFERHTKAGAVGAITDSTDALINSMR